jgi:hypothetical protein
VLSLLFDMVHAAHYIGCALSVALAVSGAGLVIAIFNCITLMVIDP